MTSPNGHTRRAVLAVAGLTVLSACGPATTEKGGRPAAAAPPPSGTPSAPPTRSASPSPPARVQKKPDYTLRRASSAGKPVALTFDDGPHPSYTREILSILADHDVTATFFMIGSNVAGHPDIVRKVAEAGHAIGTHTWSHANLKRLSATAVRDEIERAVDEVETTTGQRPALFRAPYGNWSPTVFRRCAELGQRSVAWNVDPRDWEAPGAAVIRSRVLDQVRSGSIVLDHDGGGDRSQTVSALRAFLPRLLDAGYTFVGV